MNRLTNMVACLFLFLSSLGALAENSQNTPALYAGTKIDDPDINFLVVSLLNTYLLLREGTVVRRATENEVADMNFYYASGPDFIFEQRLSERALVAFETDAIDALVELPTNSDTCYVQWIALSAGPQRLLLAVHHEDNDDQEDVFRCLIAGLWEFQDRDLNDLDVSDWRGSFYKLAGIGSN